MGGQNLNCKFKTLIYDSIFLKSVLALSSRGDTAPLAPPPYTPLVILTMMSALNVRIKVGTPYSHNFNPIERFHITLWSPLKAKKANGDNDWGKSLPTLILAYNATQHYSTLCRPVSAKNRFQLSTGLNLETNYN